MCCFFFVFFFCVCEKPTSNRRNVPTTTEARADRTIRFMNELAADSQSSQRTYTTICFLIYTSTWENAYSRNDYTKKTTKATFHKWNAYNGRMMMMGRYKMSGAQSRVSPPDGCPFYILIVCAHTYICKTLSANTLSSRFTHIELKCSHNIVQI